MKGIVFTEFLEMIERDFGYEIVDQILNDNQLESGGAYTSVGTYNHAEMIQLLSSLSKVTSQDVSTLLEYFGNYMFVTFRKGFPAFFDDCEHGFEFLESIDNHIHVEVKKLYPDAMLPRFESEKNGNEMHLRYFSDRRMSDFALGLIKATMHHYGHGFSVEKAESNTDGTEVLFLIKIAA